MVECPQKITNSQGFAASGVKFLKDFERLRNTIKDPERLCQMTLEDLFLGVDKDGKMAVDIISDSCAAIGS